MSSNERGDKTEISTKSPGGGHGTPAERGGDRTVIGAVERTRLHGTVPPRGDEGRTEIQGQRPREEASRDDITRYQPSGTGERVQTPPPSGPAVGSRVGATGSSAKGAAFILKDRFLMEEALGAGGMGIVYKAKDRLKVEAQDRDPYVAIKVLSDEFKSHPEAFIALQRESRKTQRLSHPNIVKVFDFDKDGGIFFMTMEYMEGAPLDRLMKQYSATGLPQEEVWTIIEGMCSALSYAHNENIVHADFKPGNIFVTSSGMAKIFDFGIARAVTKIDKGQSGAGDKTVFDAGNLGALTPAYASYEMLKGELPDVRDDIYALGCITYELLSGKHPFDKLPADEARHKKLAPKRISGINKRQWRAIEKALAFDREERIGSVSQFHHELTAPRKSRLWIPVSLVILAAAGTSGYLFINKPAVEPAAPAISESDIRKEVRIELHKEELAKLLADPLFTSVWEEGLWQEYDAVGKLLPADDTWLAGTRERIYALYLGHIEQEIAAANYDRASRLIDNGYRYAGDRLLLDGAKNRVAEALRQRQEAASQSLAQRAQPRPQPQAQVQTPPQPAAPPPRAPEPRIDAEQQRLQAQKNIDEYNLAMANVNRQLECRTRLNMRDFAIAIDKLKSLDADKYSRVREEIVASLASCITEEAKRFPERAIESKNTALRIFDNHPAIAAINIVARDACDTSIAGMGGSGRRAVCRDGLKGGGDGPELVVIPASANLAGFAIGKYEISSGEFKRYCEASGRCTVTGGADSELPVTGQSIATVRDYLKWLSERTGKRYRLPTRDEWAYAATSTAVTADPNRNCQFSSRGIQKGDELVKTTIGKQNAWGLVNYLGNAQEWGYGKNGQLIAMGGSYMTSMQECQISTWQDHNGDADSVTGFRVVRELSGNAQRGS